MDKEATFEMPEIAPAASSKSTQSHPPNIPTPQLTTSHAMIYKLYLYKDTLSSRRAAGSREKAVEMVNLCLEQEGELIVERFGDSDWSIVL